MQTSSKAKKVATDRQLTGMRGVYLAAAELCARGFNAAVTSRNAAGPDMLVSNKDASKSYMVQVKTNAKTFSFWLVGKNAQHTASKNYVYILVNLRKKKGEEQPEYYVVPSKVVAEKLDPGDWTSFSLKNAEPYRDKWDIFGR